VYLLKNRLIDHLIKQPFLLYRNLQSLSDVTISLCQVFKPLYQVFMTGYIMSKKRLHDNINLDSELRNLKKKNKKHCKPITKIRS
jgi:hypothetical protein